MKSTSQRNVRRISMGVTEALDLYLKEHEGMFELMGDSRGRIDLRWAMRIAFEEGLIAIIEHRKAHPEERFSNYPLRFDMADGPRRLREYEERIIAVEIALAKLPPDS